MAKKKIIMIDDEPLIPSLIQELLEMTEEGELEIARITANKDEFLDLVLNEPFDAALIDISVGSREGGLDLLRDLKHRGLDLPAIMLSAHDEMDYAVKCLQAGAAGYVNKNSICKDLIPGLKQACAGHLFISGEEGPRILRQYTVDESIRLTAPA